MSESDNCAPLRLASGCKINLYLKITGVRQDGYHLLESLFLPLSAPSDTLVISPGSRSKLTFRCDDPSIPQKGNTICMAYSAFSAKTGFSPPLDVLLYKKVPHGAGLGGGSANAAVMLLHLATLALKAGISIDTPSLSSLAASIGADVPYFLVNKPALVSGIGDVIKEIANPLPGWHLVLVCPPLHVSTAWAFAAWDKKNNKKDASLSLTTPRDLDTKPIVHGWCVENNLCAVVFEQHPELRHIVLQLQKLGADAASMSGSGSSLFGLFKDGETAEHAFRVLGQTGLAVFHHVL